MTPEAKAKAAEKRAEARAARERVLVRDNRGITVNFSNLCIISGEGNGPCDVKNYRAPATLDALVAILRRGNRGNRWARAAGIDGVRYEFRLD